MLTTIAIILVVLWALGFFGGFVLGGFIHVLLVIAVILFLIRVIQGRNPLQ
jgi:asparagine N-glycosylation enzyme membrane subunit Stt3